MVSSKKPSSFLDGAQGQDLQRISSFMFENISFSFVPSNSFPTILPPPQKHTDGIFYGDTPGLQDVQKAETAAGEITKALSKNGLYKLIFVVTIEAGRVRGEDVATINLVLKAINHKVSYGIIVNKATTGLLKKMQCKEVREAVFAGLNSGEMKTGYVHYMLRDDEIEDETDQVPSICEDLIEFIYRK